MDEIQDDREDTITMNQECGVETRQKLGVLWPPAVYKSAMGSDPRPDQLSRIKIGGVQVTGVLRDAIHGSPTGQV